MFQELTSNFKTMQLENDKVLEVLKKSSQIINKAQNLNIIFLNKHWVIFGPQNRNSAQYINGF